MESHNLDCVNLLIYMVNCFVDLAEASLPNQVDVFKFVLKPPVVKNVLER